MIDGPGPSCSAISHSVLFSRLSCRADRRGLKAPAALRRGKQARLHGNLTEKSFAERRFGGVHDDVDFHGNTVFKKAFVF